MDQQGEIVAVGSGRATVRVRRPGGCEHCGGCELGASPETTIELPNPENLAVGTVVRLQVDEGEVVKAAGLVYLVPLAGLFLGFGVGQVFRTRLGLTSELWILGFGLLFLAAGLGLVAQADRRSKSKRCLPRMSRLS